MHTRKGSAVIILVIIIAILFVTLGYFVFSKNTIPPPEALRGNGTAATSPVAATTTPANWKDAVNAQFKGLADWNTENLTEWRLNGTLDAGVVAQLPKGSVVLLSKVFETPTQPDPDQRLTDQRALEVRVRAVLADNGWKLTAGPTERGFYQDYLYMKEGHPLILKTGTRDAVVGGMYVTIEFLN